MKLVVIDFDGVVTKQNMHTHNWLCGFKVAPYSKKEGLVLNGVTCDENMEINKDYNIKNVKQFGGKLLTEDAFQFPEEFVQMVRDVLQAEIHVVIATHNQFPAIVPFALEKLGFTKEEVESIDIISGSPQDKSECKNEHIKLAMDLKGIKSASEVVLIDDTYMNCITAQELGCEAVWVDSNATYFLRLQDIVFPNCYDSSDLEIIHGNIEDYDNNEVSVIGDDNE